MEWNRLKSHGISRELNESVGLLNGKGNYRFFKWIGENSVWFIIRVCTVSNK